MQSLQKCRRVQKLPSALEASEMWNAMTKCYASWTDFAYRVNSIASSAYLSFAKGASESRSTADFRQIERKALSNAREVFDSEFRKKEFVKSLADYVESYSNLAKVSGIGTAYQNLSNIAAMWNNAFEPLRDHFFRTPSHQIHREGKFALYHYTYVGNHSPGKVKTPLLVVYAFINRHYILDLLPQVSVIRNLASQGFDIYATDWGTPGAYDKDLTLGHYVNNYIDRSIDFIKKHTGAEKVSLLGYCWGGDLALMYATLHPEKVKNIVTLATPGDFSLDDGLLSVWTKGISADAVIDSFGNAPSLMLNAAFALRSPIDYVHKYPHFLERPRDLESLLEFMATEVWLYDSPPVIGEIYRQFVKDCYQRNLLIKNQLVIGNEQTIDLHKIHMPFLNIIATKDDLVDPRSSKALSDAISSKDKKTLELKSGHVGTCISSAAHTELWPQAGQWLKERS